MSINSLPGLSSSIAAPVGNYATGTLASAAQATAAKQASPAPKAEPPPPKTAQPFVLVPTEPLTPKVLAELIGRQLGLNGSGVPQ